MTNETMPLPADTFSGPAPDEGNIIPDVPNGDDEILTADQPLSEENGKRYIPYTRFKEVIDERNQLREQIGSIKPKSVKQENRLSHESVQLTDDELNMLWDQNPVQAAKLMFSNMFSVLQDNERRRDECFARTLSRYPELADSNHEISRLTRQIITDELPDLLNDPRGVSIAAEIAAARYYKDQFGKITRRKNLSKQELEATRQANVRGAFVEHGTYPKRKTFHDGLSSEEQRIANLMGVPLESYARNKQTVQ